jgi:eukaryotic-like serine/threonine-protein kinase
MPLAVSTRLGPYEILAPIGAGGMGEVYRARDTKLDRDVAIKVLPSALAENPERMARFEREAKTLAALNHPNIAAIYGLQDGAIVMELVEGPTLAERLTTRPIPIDEALKIAAQIADALEAAHEKGIVHRDLKPANIKVPAEGAVKVLDFGLATAVQARDRESADPANSPTLTIGATEVGVILGTAAYMSPEQASGKRVDKRADIWSFGVVLWEMLTGKRLFGAGETPSHTLADVLRAPIDFGKLPASTPASIAELLRRCLDRDVKTRLRDIGEARVAIQRCDHPALAERQPGIFRSRVRLLGPWIFTAVAIASAAGIAFMRPRMSLPPAAAVHFQLQPPENVTIAGGISLSPDGRWLVFNGFGGDGQLGLWIRSLEGLENHMLPGTELPSGVPIWSPDSRFIAFTAEGKLKKIAVAGGSPQSICDEGGQVAGGSWTPDNRIVLGHIQSGLQQVSANGGVPSPVTILGQSQREQGHLFPWILPDGRHFLYTRRGGPAGGIYIGSLDKKPEEQSLQKLLPDQSAAIFVPSNALDAGRGKGYLLFTRESTLMAQRFDADGLQFLGEPVSLAEGIRTAGTGTVSTGFAASSNGVLTYLTGAVAFDLTWFDRTGKSLGTIGAPGAHNMLALSHDGSQLASSRDGDIWLLDIVRNASRRLTYERGIVGFPVWSPDGSRVAFSYGQNGAFDLYQKRANGTGEEELIFKSAQPKNLNDWSRDGRFLLYSVIDPKTKSDLWELPLGDSRKPARVAGSEFFEGQGQFSPDGQWIAYVSDETGRDEIYIRPSLANASSAGGGIVSQGGGYQPRWRPDGKELFYFSSDRTIMAAELISGPALKVGVPKALFQAPIGGAGVTTNVHRWDVAPDGQRFLLAVATKSVTTAPITIVVNWQVGLRK